MRIIKFALLSLLFSACYSTEQNCEKFRTGTFKFDALVEGEVITTTFVRNDSIEIETYNGQTDTASIRWINDCQYILKSINPESMAENKPIEMRILYSDGNTYTFEYNIVGNTNKQRGTAVKISD